MNQYCHEARSNWNQSPGTAPFAAHTARFMAWLTNSVRKQRRRKLRQRKCTPNQPVMSTNTSTQQIHSSSVSIMPAHIIGSASTLCGRG